jgi:hypothetical protein
VAKGFAGLQTVDDLPHRYLVQRPIYPTAGFRLIHSPGFSFFFFFFFLLFEHDPRTPDPERANPGSNIAQTIAYHHHLSSEPVLPSVWFSLSRVSRRDRLMAVDLVFLCVSAVRSRHAGCGLP